MLCMSVFLVDSDRDIIWASEMERETHATSAVLNPQAGCHVSS